MLIFIYGSLKRGRADDDVILMVGGKFIKETETKPLYALYDLGWCPGIVKDKENRSIKGELYEIKNIGSLDQYEGVYLGIFTRSKIELKSGENAMAYFLNYSPQNALLVDSNEW